MSEDKNETGIVLPRRAFFIDSENGIETLIEGCGRLSQHDRIVVFHRNTISKKVRNKLEACSAQLEWVECVDKGIKNSMDFQIVAELSLQLARDSFDEGYIISRDNGFKAAIHYLQRQSAASSRKLMVAQCIYQAAYESLLYAFRKISPYQEIDALQQLCKFFFGRHMAEGLSGAISGKTIADQVLETTVNDPSESPQYSANQRSTAAAVLDFNSFKRGMADQLTDLKGIGEALSRKLMDVGVTTPQELQDIGSAKAWEMVREKYPSFSARWRRIFETAIRDSSSDRCESKQGQSIEGKIRSKAS